MSASGKAIVPGNSQLLAGPLGNGYIAFDGWNLGLTTEDTNLEFDKDIKDILYSQRGTKPSDHVETGKLMVLNATFGEVSTSLLKLIDYAFISNASDDGTGDDSGVFIDYMYKSLRENKAKVLRFIAADANGEPLTQDYNIKNFYEAVPIIESTYLNWGADTQRNVPVRFMIYSKIFGTEQISGGPYKAFGYYGDPATNKVPAVVWPDLAGPQVQSAEATTATNVDVVFDENLALQGGSYTGGIIVKVNGAYVVPTGASVSTVTLSVTLPASSISAGDDVEISISDTVLEDTESTPNDFAGIDNYAVTNSVT